MAEAGTNDRRWCDQRRAISVPTDKDLGLWALPPGELKPRSLGVLPPSRRQLTAQLTPSTQLLVSLEPKGGSPTGHRPDWCCMVDG